MKKTLTAAAKAVLKNKKTKNIKSTVKTDTAKQKVTAIKPPTISLSKSIDKSQKQITKKREQKKNTNTNTKTTKTKCSRCKSRYKNKTTRTSC